MVNFPLLQITRGSTYQLISQFDKYTIIYPLYPPISPEFSGFWFRSPTSLPPVRLPHQISAAAAAAGRRRGRARAARPDDRPFGCSY